MEISDFRLWEGLDKAKYTMHFFNDAYTQLHGHVYWELVVMTNERINHILNNNSNVLKKNDYCLISPFDLHRFSLIKDVHSQHLNMCITNEEFKRLCDFTDNSLYDDIVTRKIEVRGTLSQNELDTFLDIADRVLMCEATQTRKKNMLISSLFFELIKLIINKQVEPSPAYPDWLSMLLDKMNRVENINLDVEDIILISGFSHTHLLRQFKKYVGITISEYITNKKMHFCCNLLENTNCTTLEICNRIGFSSLSHLNHVFKEKYEMTPTEYRKKRNKL